MLSFVEFLHFELANFIILVVLQIRLISNIMSFEEDQKGLFTFYIEQSQLQTHPSCKVYKSLVNPYKNKRTSQGGELLQKPNLTKKLLIKPKTRHKSGSFDENSDRHQQNLLQREAYSKQKNKTRVLGQNQILNKNLKYQRTTKRRTNQQYSNACNLKAHLEDLRTSKKISSQKNVNLTELKSLSMKKNFSQPGLKSRKNSQQYRVLRLQTIVSQIQRPEELIKKEGMNEKLRKRAIFLTKSRKLLKSKMKQLKQAQQNLRLLEQKQNERMVKQTNEYENYAKKRYKKYKRVNNPIKHSNQPYLEPISNEKIKPFRQYLVNIQQFGGTGTITRDSYSKARFSQNASSFAAQRQIDCIKLMDQLRKIRHS